MANYTVNFTCGHSRMMQLYGPEKDRQSKIQWLQKCDCLACERKAREAEGAKAWAGFLASPRDDRPGFVVALVDAYPIKDNLRARGYFYEPEGRGRNFFFDIVGGRSTPPEWRRIFPASLEGKAALEAEMAELVALGLVATDKITLQPPAEQRIEMTWSRAMDKAREDDRQARAEPVAVARLSAAAKPRVRARPLPAPYTGDPIQITDLGVLGATVRLPASIDVRDDFRRRFPRARFNGHTAVWGVPGKLAARRLTVWASRIMDANTLIHRQRAIDDATFDGVSSPYVVLGEGECIVDTPYNATIVAICKGLGGKWDAGHKVWRIDGSMLKAVIAAVPQIDKLARETRP